MDIFEPKPIDYQGTVSATGLSEPRCESSKSDIYQVPWNDSCSDLHDSQITDKAFTVAMLRRTDLVSRRFGKHIELLMDRHLPFLSSRDVAQ